MRAKQVLKQFDRLLRAGFYLELDKGTLLLFKRHMGGSYVVDRFSYSDGPKAAIAEATKAAFNHRSKADLGS